MPVDPNSAQPFYYEIKISGRLSPAWAEWFGGLSIQTEDAAGRLVFTTLSGRVADQSALFGILNRIRDLSLRLISVNVIRSETVESAGQVLVQEGAK